MTEDDWPRPVPTPGPDEMVAVVMSEMMARRFEELCLGQGNTVGPSYLSGPMLYFDGDLPTYVIGT